MRVLHLTATSLLAAVAMAATTCRAEETPPMQMVQPTKEHKLLEQFSGEWTSVAEAPMPDGESFVCRGAETTRMLGGLWLVAKNEGEMPGGGKGESMITLGYDAAKKKYVGTFVCSAQDMMWEYEGAFDETGKKLVLETWGPSMTDPTKQAKYQEVLTLVDADHKEFTSSMEGPDGKWIPMVTVKYERKK